MFETPAVLPPDEPCTATPAPLPPGFVEPPAWAVESLSEMRLIPHLRSAAKTRDPYEILARSATAFFYAQIGSGLVPNAGDALGVALADLAVTGRRAYCLFAHPARTPADQDRVSAAGDHVDLGTTPYNDAELLTKISGLLGALYTSNPTLMTRAITRALDRAFTTAWALRGPPGIRRAIRGPLGWIAVSGEDDVPHRPTNVPASHFEVYEIPVSVPAAGGHRALTVQTRFIIASPGPPAGTPASSALPVDLLRVVPPDPRPVVPEGDQVLLFLHGHVSGAEEALDIIPQLHAAALARGRGLSIVSVDLPNCGYSETFDHERVAATAATQYPSGPFDREPIRTPVLDFIEDFVVAFVDALDRITPIKNRFVGVFGGSLGGNLGLRLGRRRPMPAWLNRGIVSWNAASVWDPMVNDHLKSQAPGRCFERWQLAETAESRTTYFQEVYDTVVLPILVHLTQPQLWYHPFWQPCKSMNIRGSRVARRETYSPRLRQWHWRVAGEQLIYSHVDRVDRWDATSPWRYELNTVKQLLIASADDNFTGSNIFDATRTLANKMSATPGKSLFLLYTGHSVHFERPRYLAEQIVDFLLPAARPGTPTRWESLGGSLASAPAASSWAPGRLDVFARGGDSALWRKTHDGVWRDWESLGGHLMSAPAAVSRATNRIDVFARGHDNALWQKAHDSRWFEWASLGHTIGSGPAVSSWAPGRLDVFARSDRDYSLWHTWYDNGWIGSDSLGGVLASEPAAISWAANRIDVFARGQDDALWHIWYDHRWSGWESLGGTLASAPAVSSWGPGRLDVFARGRDNALWHLWYDGHWSAWESLGGALRSAPAAVSWAASRIDVFARGHDDALWHIWYDGRWRP